MLKIEPTEGFAPLDISIEVEDKYGRYKVGEFPSIVLMEKGPYHDRIATPGVHEITYSLPGRTYSTLVAVLPDTPIADIPIGLVEVWLDDHGNFLYFGTSEITEADPLPAGYIDLPPSNEPIYELAMVHPAGMEHVAVRHALLLTVSRGDKQFDRDRIICQVIFGMYVQKHMRDIAHLSLRMHRHYIRQYDGGL